MTDRDIQKDKLIELLLQSDPIKERDLDDDWFDGELEDIADHLLANGTVVLDTSVISPKNRPLITHFADMPINDVLDLVRAKREGRLIVPPCKVGDTIYKLSILGETVELKVKGFDYAVITEPYNSIPFNTFGKTVFLTKEEAEQALAERGRDNGKM